MENASKALLIAGEVLIAMLVASMMVLLFSTMSSYADEHEERKKVEKVQAFNANVMQYMKNTGITAQDIVSLANFAKQVNEQMGCTADTRIDTDHETKHMNIQVNNDKMELKKDSELIQFLEDNYPGEEDINKASRTGFKYYKATEIKYFDDGRIRKIVFQKID